MFLYILKHNARLETKLISEEKIETLMNDFEILVFLEKDQE